MVANYYETLLKEISEVLEIETLEPDENNTCLIKFINGLEVQIEPEKKGDFLILGTNLGNVPVGRFREDIFETALIANALPYPRSGTFSYSEKAASLVLHEYISLKNLTGQKVVDRLDPFMAKANAWREAIDQGSIPEVKLPEAQGGGSGLFGLVR